MKSVLITGSTSGIGLAAALVLATRGWAVLAVGRRSEGCESAANSIRSVCPKVQLTFFRADLSSQAEVVRLAGEVSRHLQAEHGGRLDVLINNAGMVCDYYQESADGIEMQFAVNHLAGFLLANLLAPALRLSPAGRILTVSSQSHRHARIHWADIGMKVGYSCLGAYKQSKFCNVLFTHEWNRREGLRTIGKDSVVRQVHAFAVDPGLVNTGIGSKGTAGLVPWFWSLRRRMGTVPSQAARTIVHLCEMPVDWDPPGSYFKDCAPLPPDRRSLDPVLGQRLWKLSLDMLMAPAEFASDLNG